MGGLDREARALKALLGGRGFVRRDRSGQALFVTDAPRRMDEDAWEAAASRLRHAGYTLTRTDGLAFISWDFPKGLAFCQALVFPEGWAQRQDSLAGFLRILARQPTAFTREMLPHFCRALALWDAGKHEALRRAAEAALADALRLRSPLPAYFLPLLLHLPERRTP